ncbi:MAG: GNAT family N-acetyltransferase [Chloroflexota bacterium]
MTEPVEIMDVDANNLDQQGFFCYKSKPKSPGYQHKLAWLRARFAEGMRIKILYEGKRSVGFIEYTPGEYAWRAVNAPGYLVIHCLWVVGKGKGKGYGTRLLDACLQEAREAGFHGVVMLSSSRVWLASSELFLKNGFERIDQAPPSFDLLAKRFDEAPLPSFPTDWEARQGRYGAGLSVIYADQCPYMEDAVRHIAEAAQELNIPFQAIQLTSGGQVQAQASSPYGVFNVIYNGKLLSYHYLLKDDLLKLIEPPSQE